MSEQAALLARVLAEAQALSYTEEKQKAVIEAFKVPEQQRTKEQQALVKELADAVQAAKNVNDSRAQVLRAMELKGRDAAQQLI